MKTSHLFYLIVILILAVFLRFYGINWDQGFHLHPDERAIVMLTTPLHFPQSVNEFLSPTSPWNPHFFAYGNFPLYLLKATASILVGFDPLFISYEKINLVGRAISVIADIGTLILIYFLAKKLFNQTIGLVASFFYAISVFPIQAAHFYAVDTLLTFFIILTLYMLVRFYEKPTVLNSIQVGIFLGLSLSTKVSAIPLVIAVFAAIGADFTLLVIKQPHKPHIWFLHIPRFLKRLIVNGVIIVIATGITFTILQPYAIFDFQEFWRQSMQQRQMTFDAFTFPYTLQYVGKIPYWYELKNIFLWGQGPILATLSLLGVLYISYKTMKQWNSRTIIILIFFWVYFLIVGKFAVGWMRYMLPLYPLLALFAAVFSYRALQASRAVILSEAKNLMGSFGIRPQDDRRHKIPTVLFLIFTILFFILLMVWPLSFMHIYTKPNTRVLASNWINQNVPYGATLAIEHWDDGLPLFGQQYYRMLTLELYNPDTPYKWQTINQQLAQTDYIIVASNRLYVPLVKLTDCSKLPVGRCYTQTAEYYKRLFSGQNVILSSSEGSQRDSSVASFPQNDIKGGIRFTKVAEFSIFPQLSIFNLQLSIDDSSADESFTVYDHPKIMIFKKQDQSLMQNF